MSTAKGSTERRNRPQKYKNKFAFKNDLHDKTPKMQFINLIQISAVCQHCKAQLEWKIKYKKYKPLSQPKTCIKCSQRNVLKAYHVMCAECAKERRCCAKCQKPASEKVQIEPVPPTTVEQMKLKSEMDRLMKSWPERKRRTFNRFMNKGKESENQGEEGEDGEVKKKKFVPHSKDELLEKFKALEVEDDDDDDDDDFGSDSDFGEESDSETDDK